MRPIDADKFKRHLKAECNPYGSPTIDTDAGVRVLDLLDKEPTLELPGWIRVDERLPDNNRSVLVQYRETYSTMVFKSYAVAFFGQNTKKWKEPLSGNYLDVTAWRELEEQPKPEEKAHWVECCNELDKKCSACGEQSGTIYDLPKFCPKCGKEMHGLERY